MPHNIDQQRRSLLISSTSVATGLVATPAVGAQVGSLTDRQLRFTSLAEAEHEALRLANAKAMASDATWNWAQTLAHCAQSIEYAMSGYPQSKPRLFQLTVGSAAFGIFSWRGRMSHDLGEPIPGAQPLDARQDPSQAMERLRNSIRRFQGWSGPLKPHFAYGVLDKAEYELAHAMHLANHLSAFRVKTP